ncbi:unnamed protein product [Sphagnum balticum]
MGLPPIEILERDSMVREHVSIVHVGNAEEKAEGASYLADFAMDSRNASIICEEGGVPPLLHLLREGTPGGQEEAARALGYLAADRRRVLRMRKEVALSSPIYSIRNAETLEGSDSCTKVAATTEVVPCLTAMGSLACIFPAAARVIPPITAALASRDVAVAAEASRTLYKFANKENYLHVDHSRTILESNGALHLVALLNYLDVSTQTSALKLLCCLSINVPESNLLAQAGLPFGSAIPAPPSTQDLHYDGEGGQTHRMGNNTSLLELPTEFGTQQLGKPMLQDQRKIWLVNILLPYDCMRVQAS